ncbi:MAG: hypothetical protein IPM81_06080 [Saprospirales bacterium]|nr:hypothetical protein [Saprospirales bacterium]
MKPAPAPPQNDPVLQGLTDTEVIASRHEHGSNSLYFRPKRQFWNILWEVFREPVFYC